MGKVHLLDYVAGNIRSLVNAIEKCGHEVEWIQSPEDIRNAEVCVSVYRLHLKCPSRFISSSCNTIFLCSALALCVLFCSNPSATGLQRPSMHLLPQHLISDSTS